MESSLKDVPSRAQQLKSQREIRSSYFRRLFSPIWMRKGKKLKSTGFKQHFLSALYNGENSFNASLDQSFKDWRKQEEQIGDVCILRVGF